MRPAALLCVLLLAFPACRGRGEKSGKTAKPGATAAGAPAAANDLPRATEDRCPECDGTGRCLRCGDDRPCVDCDGDGRCAVCGGDGRTPDGECDVCEGSGKCVVCGGDGAVAATVAERVGDAAELPGECPLCLLGSGLCPGCGGDGERPRGGVCALCGGEKRCPECLGTGQDLWCAGTGRCPSCRGHGRVVGGRPGEGWPPARLRLTAGGVITGKLLERPDVAVAVEYVKSGRPTREALLAKDVEPVDYVTALRRYVDDTSVEDHLELASFALKQGPGLLFLARSELAAARRLDPESRPAERLTHRLETMAAAALVAAARTALDEDEDPVRAVTLLRTAANAFPGGERNGSLLAEAGRRLAAPAESPEARARRERAEAGRFARALRRARQWRERALALLARTDAVLLDYERARHAARRARIEALRAANEAPASVDTGPAREEAARADAVRLRAILALSRDLLDLGLLERARAVTAIALARAPDDEGVRRQTAVVEEALTRRAAGEDGR